MLLLFAVKNDSPQEINLSEILGGSDDSPERDRVFKNENYMKAVRSWLPFFNERGYLDTMIKDKDVTEVL